MSTFSGVPARAVTVSASWSTATIPVRPSGRSMVASGAEIAVKLWPVPTILTVLAVSSARRTSATTSPASAGVASRVGRAVSRRDQFVQVLTPRAY